MVKIGNFNIGLNIKGVESLIYWKEFYFKYNKDLLTHVK